ncbi:hypothetical protein D3C86_1707630 [compost metagenome]
MDTAPYNRGAQCSLRINVRDTCSLHKKYFHQQNHGLLDSDHTLDIYGLPHSLQTESGSSVHLHDWPRPSNIWRIDNLHLHRLHRRSSVHLTGHLCSNDTSIALTIYRFGRQALAPLFRGIELLAWLYRCAIVRLSIQGLQLALYAFYNRWINCAN